MLYNILYVDSEANFPTNYIINKIGEICDKNKNKNKQNYKNKNNIDISLRTYLESAFSVYRISCSIDASNLLDNELGKLISDSNVTNI
jgi:hypothetical protein